MSDTVDATNSLTALLDDFEWEIRSLYDALILQNWDRPEPRGRARFPHILYGCVMWCFSFVDLVSCCWKGALSSQGQSKRIVDFLQNYLHRPRFECSVAVNIWRHKMMHTAEPRRLHENGIAFHWLLHWGDELPKDQHFSMSADGKTFRMALFYLVQDVRTALNCYLAELAVDSMLRANFDAVQRDLQHQKLNRY
ncbi:MAG: hypothetical protein ACE14L_01335 [Terriglobales bacterium]